MGKREIKFVDPFEISKDSMFLKQVIFYDFLHRHPECAWSGGENLNAWFHRVWKLATGDDFPKKEVDENENS
jgi:hypothetical protein